MPRPRVLGEHMVELQQLDAPATRAAGHFDDVYREPKLVDDGTWEGASGREDQAPIRVPAQVQLDRFNASDPMVNGVEQQHDLRVVFAMRDLERAGLIDPGTAIPAIRVTAQLLGIYDRRGTLLLDVTADRLFCTETKPEALIGSSVGLLRCTFKCREAGVKG
jgi:hypothetical protein